MRSQWRTASAGLGGFVFTGLDYAAVEPTLRLMRVKPKHEDKLFQWLRVMEMEGLKAMNERN